MQRGHPSAGVRLAAIGDLYIGRPFRHTQHPDFQAAVDAFRACDVRLANLEFQLLAGHEAGAAAAPGAWAGGPSSLVEELQWLGVQAVSTANNHAGDYGEAGQASTEATLARFGIAHAGTGAHLAAARAPAFVETPAGRVAMLAASSSHLPSARAGRQREDIAGRPGVAPLRFGSRYRIDREAYAALERILARMPVEKLAGHRESPLQRRYDAERGPGLTFFGTHFACADDFGIESWAAEDDLEEIGASVHAARSAAHWVVLQLHVHEYDNSPAEPPAFAVEAARKAIDCGADAVICHGEHGVRGIEMHEGRPIFHGIGAFVFQPYLFPTQPADFYEAYGMRNASLTDVYRERRERAGFFERLDYWEALLLRLDLRRNELPGFDVQPITLWPHGSDTPTGLPYLARNSDGLKLLDKVRQLSANRGAALTLEADAFCLHGAQATRSSLQQ